MPTGIVTVVPPPIAERISTLWDGLNREFGIRASADSTPLPHITFHVAKTYAQPALQQALTAWAATAAAYKVRTWGVGIFGGERTVIFVGITRTTRIASLHENLHRVGQRYATDPVPIFDPATWVPHITLVHSDISAEMVGAIASWLHQYDFIWEFSLNTLSVIQNMSSQPNTNFTISW